jgi:hypothetical protein
MTTKNAKARAKAKTDEAGRDGSSHPERDEAAFRMGQPISLAIAKSHLSGERLDLSAFLLRFEPEVVLKLGFGEEIGGERKSFSEANAQVGGDCGTTVEDARDGGAGDADVFRESGGGDVAEEGLKQFSGRSSPG